MVVRCRGSRYLLERGLCLVEARASRISGHAEPAPAAAADVQGQTDRPADSTPVGRRQRSPLFTRPARSFAALHRQTSAVHLCFLGTRVGRGTRDGPSPAAIGTHVTESREAGRRDKAGPTLELRTATGKPSSSGDSRDAWPHPSPVFCGSQTQPLPVEPAGQQSLRAAVDSTCGQPRRGARAGRAAIVSRAAVSGRPTIAAITNRGRCVCVRDASPGRRDGPRRGSNGRDRTIYDHHHEGN